jgi:hypothetical protein
MLVEIKKEYTESEDYFYLDLNINFEEDEDERLTNTIHRNFMDLGDGLKRNFGQQEKLYALINADKYADNKYNPNGEAFYHGDRGFREFVKDLSERELRLLTEVYTDLILEKVEYTHQMYRQRHRSRVEVSTNNDTEAIQLEQLSIKEPAMIIANNKCYQVEFKAVKDKNSLEDVQEGIYKTIYDDLHTQMQTQKKNADRKIERLKAKFEKEKNKLFVETLLNAGRELNDWAFAEYEDGMYLKYKHEIVTSSVTYNGREYDYDGEEYKKLYVQGLRVKIKEYIRGDDVRVTRGQNLHFDGSSGCIGELSGRPLFDVLKELPEALKIANMNSPLNDDVRSYLSRNFISQFRDGDGNVGGGHSTNEWRL